MQAIHQQRETWLSTQCFNQYLTSIRSERSDNETPQWRYYYRGVWPNQNPFAWLGSYHSSKLTPTLLCTGIDWIFVSGEIPQIWGTAETWGGNKLGGPNTPEEAAFSRYIQRAWATFAKDPINGLSSLGWPKYNLNENTLVQLAYNGSTIPQFVSPMVADKNCTLPGHCMLRS